jgi:CDP-glucose 4,6-dehydratase
LGGHDPYSNSKACAELVSASYRDSYFRKMNIGLATVRAGNVIGGGDWACDRLIPDMIRGCMNKNPVMIRNPSALRPWQHVLDPLSGYLQIAEKLYLSPAEYAEGWNFGPDDHDIKPVGWIADFITRNWGGQSCWRKDAGEHPHEATYLKLDCSKVKSRLGWYPQMNLEQGLEETIAWYKAFASGAEMKNFTLSQIKHFMNSNINSKREHRNVETTIS